MIIYFNEISLTTGEVCLLGYEEGNPSTSNIVCLQIKSPVPQFNIPTYIRTNENVTLWTTLWTFIAQSGQSEVK